MGIITNAVEHIIGIDHGNGFVKTVSTFFKTGIAEYATAPPISAGQKVVRFNKRYYVCDSGPGTLKEDKTRDEHNWILTLAGIGEELAKRRVKPDLQNGINITLAVGLPLTYPESDHKALKKYLTRKNVEFWYCGKHWIININKVLSYPQGYSAIMRDMESIKQTAQQPLINIVDIGSWTVDVIAMAKGKPDLNKALTLDEQGVIRCITSIREQVRRNTKIKLADEQVEAVLWSKDALMRADVKKEIIKGAGLYAEHVMSELAKNGFDAGSAPMAFVGGGARIIKRYFPQKSLFAPVYYDDVRFNAQGYETLAALALKRR